MIFIPLGVYFKMLKVTDLKTVLFGLLVSLGLEVLQFILAVGATDITDIITNTAGTALGVGVYALLSRIFKKTKSSTRYYAYWHRFVPYCSFF